MEYNSIQQEFETIENSKKWLNIFQEIREKCDTEAKEKSFSVTEATKSENRSLNRYRDVNPYDHSRIIIHRGNVDYVNANLVKCEKADRKYILTQGPLKDTVGHFWLMIWEQNSKAILMLNKLVEKSQIKCNMYWPEKIGEEYKLNLPEVGLTVEYLKCEEYKHFSKNLFRLTDTESGKFREVVQFHYTTWPDFGIPSSPVAFLQFLKQVRDSGALDPDVGPAVVHCSAGIGRSGTFCLVDCCLVLIKKEGENNVSVRQVLYELRRYRMGLIQTADQLYFSYQAIIEGMNLLDDPKFLENQELLTVNNNGNGKLELDETPPPLPPARKESLKIISSLNRNNNTTNNEQNNDNDKNDINNTDKYILNSTISQRPLPPLPPLKRVAESDYSDNSSYEKSDSDMDDDNNLSQNDMNTKQGTNKNETNDTNSNIDKNYEKSNGIEKGSDSSTDIRRRWPERQADIEKKVNEMKRKHREAENESEASAKKKRTLTKFLTAGLIVGVICIFAYSKLT